MTKTRTQMYGKKNSYTGAVGSQLQRPGSKGVQGLSQGHLCGDKEVNCQPSSCQPTNPFFERWVGFELPTLWLLDDHTHHCAMADPNTNRKTYGKNRHTNVWKKHAYKGMTKTRIQTRIQMYEKNTDTNVWKKHTNTHTNVWQKYTHILDSQFQHQGGMGCLAQGHLSCGKEVNCQPSSCQTTIPLFE